MEAVMATAVVDGIKTRYEIFGSGPPLLMFSPGGFDATVEKWRTQSIYATIKFLDHLPEHYTCIAFDRRETGQSGGRIERVSWRHFAAQGKALLDHLGYSQAYVMGGCMGCNATAAFGAAYPETTLGMVLFWPVGGARYRISGHQRFAEHLAFVREHGLPAVVDIAVKEGKSFGVDPRGGPWVSVLRGDAAFAESFLAQDAELYRYVVVGMARTLLDRDTCPCAEPEDLLRLKLPALIVPGSDTAHATSAARYLEECIPGARYWDVPVSDQTEEATNRLVLEFLRSSQRSR
jgi:pimeloyl-ACP methyl ester carboxylesterase